MELWKQTLAAAIACKYFLFYLLVCVWCGGIYWRRACVMCVTIDIRENLEIWKLLSSHGSNHVSVEEVLRGCKGISIEDFV